jgi:hypothetical protein
MLTVNKMQQNTTTAASEPVLRMHGEPSACHHEAESNRVARVAAGNRSRCTHTFRRGANARKPCRRPTMIGSTVCAAHKSAISAAPPSSGPENVDSSAVVDDYYLMLVLPRHKRCPFTTILLLTEKIPEMNVAELPTSDSPRIVDLMQMTVRWV